MTIQCHSDMATSVIKYEENQRKLRYADLTKSSLTISSDGGYIRFGTLTEFGISVTSWIVGFFIRGWSGDVGAMSLVSGSDGTIIYLMGSKAGTMTSVTVRVWYYEA